MSTQHMAVWYMPVIHQGYLNYWQHLIQTNSSAEITIAGITPALAAKLQSIQPDPATLSPEEVSQLWSAISKLSIQWLDEGFFSDSHAVVELFQGVEKVHLVDDAVTRYFWQLCSEQVASENLPTVQWHSVFLRWDAHSVQQMNQIDCPVTEDATARKWMHEAKKQAEKSSDWWRQVGSIAVKNNSEIMRAYNQGMPDDHTPYQMGAVRDYVPTGTQPELANYIHAEQAVIAQAANQGISLAGSDLYVTHFPCPVCAKLIAQSGIKQVFFATGSATLDGAQVLKQYGVTITQVSE